MEQSSLYNAYSMAEPWDGPNNRKLLDQRPNVYDCPSRVCGPTLTSYVAIVGPETAFPGAKFDQARRHPRRADADRRH